MVKQETSSHIKASFYIRSKKKKLYCVGKAMLIILEEINDILAGLGEQHLLGFILDQELQVEFPVAGHARIKIFVAFFTVEVKSDQLHYYRGEGTGEAIRGLDVSYFISYLRISGKNLITSIRISKKKEE